MCITKPCRVAELSGKEAVLEDGRKVKTAVKVKKGDFVLVGMGVVVEKISRKEYEKLSSLGYS
jgi:hydrogenase maturation factor